MLFKSAYIGLDEAAKMECFQPLIDAFAERHAGKHEITSEHVWRADDKYVDFESSGINAFAYSLHRLFFSHDDGSLEWLKESLVIRGYSKEMLEKVCEDYFTEMKQSTPN